MLTNSKFIFLLNALLFCVISVAQTPKIDSLKTELSSAETSLKQAKLNLTIAKQFERVDLKAGKIYATEALKLTENDSIKAEAYNQLGRFGFFTSQLDSATYYFQEAISILKQKDDNKRVAIINISLGAIQLRQGKFNKTVETLTESAKFFEQTKDSLNASKCYSNIATAFAELEIFPQAISYSEKALQIFRSLEQTQFELITLPNLATMYYKNGDTLKSITYNAEAEALAKKLDNKRSLSLIYNNLGEIYLDADEVKAKDYLEQTLALKKELNLQEGVEYAQNNLGVISLRNKDYSKAINYLETASEKLKGKMLLTNYINLSEAYKNSNNPKKALKYSESALKLTDSVLNSENQKTFVEIEAKYEAEKKETQILNLKNTNLETDIKRRKNRNFLIGALGLLVATLLIGYLMLKNSRRKQTIAEQNQILETEKVDKLLKDQELIGLDAMLEGQEKERQRIAQDIHDNLGGKLSTLKLYLEDIESTNPEAFEKINLLLDDTYNDVRNIAHEKQSSALIDKGLIPAVQLVANRIKGSKKLGINVNNIDFNSRIQNFKELQLFRIIQELLTNTIKHAKAKQVNIQFSEDENQLSLIYEDDGIGFNPNTSKRGLGLTNIEQRVTKINGNYALDTSAGNGTTVIINVPL
jgi:signal transduction histidine kinase